MRHVGGKLGPALTVLVLASAACGSIAPPETCGETGTADEARFAELFSSMDLVVEATGETGPEDPEGGATFAADTPLAIRFDSLASADVRVCVGQRRGGGQIVLDQTFTAAEGSGSFALGPFPPDIYVVRVLVDGTLIRNLPFVVP